MREHDTTVLLREIYADALEQLARAKARAQENSIRGDAAMLTAWGSIIKERERAANRIRFLCGKHGIDLTEGEEPCEE